MSRRQTPLDKAIAMLTAKIAALEETRTLLIDERNAAMIRPPKPPQPEDGK